MTGDELVDARMTADEFCRRYMNGMTPTPTQRVAIEGFLAGGTLYGAGRGAGKTAVADAIGRYFADMDRGMIRL